MMGKPEKQMGPRRFGFIIIDTYYVGNKRVDMILR